jgi:hypothetical protein
LNALLAMLFAVGEPTVSPSAWRDNDLIVPLLILGVILVFGIFTVFLVMVVHYLRTNRLAGRNTQVRLDFVPRQRRVPAGLLATPSRWLAVKVSNPRLVQTALGLHKPTPCSWDEGLSLAHEQKLFISPPLGAWVLVIGSHLPDPAEDVDRCFYFLTSLSRKLGHVQFFCANRVVNHHAWIYAEQGRIQRAYAWAGKTLWNQGRMTRAELELGLKCFDYAVAAERAVFHQADPLLLNTERVPLLAARWSVDPASVDPRLFREALGIAGELFKSKAH